METQSGTGCKKKKPQTMLFFAVCVWFCLRATESTRQRGCGNWTCKHDLWLKQVVGNALLAGLE